MEKKYTSIEKTFVMIKPDGLRRGLSGEIFKRFEQRGLKLVAGRMIQATKEQARSNYPGTDEWILGMANKTYANYKNDEKAIKEDMGTTDKMEIGNKIYDALVGYIMSSPVIITVWEGNHAVELVQKIIGSTDPMQAAIGTIRGDFGFDTPQFAVKSGRIVFHTLVHRSDSAEEAKREIEFWFGDKFDYIGDYDNVNYVGYF